MTEPPSESWRSLPISLMHSAMRCGSSAIGGTGDPEPSVAIGRNIASISAVCGLVDTFVDPLPENIFGKLYFQMDNTDTQRRLKEKLGADRTYAGAARCLLKLIEDRRAAHERIELEKRRRFLCF
jgi:hypothetical protein